MNLMKMFRKNNKKILAVVVVLLMVAFVGGYYIQQITRQRAGNIETFAHFADNRPLTNYNVSMAMNEIEILKLLGADYLLRSMSNRYFNVQDMQALLLGELVFSEGRYSSSMSNVIKRTIASGGYNISDKQVNEIFANKKFSDATYWYLLTEEARLAGIAIPKEEARRNLAAFIRSLAGASIPEFRGVTYSAMVSRVEAQKKISEDEMLNVFGKLLAVLTYARTICSDEDVTIPQVRFEVSREGDLIDVGMVEFDSKLFVDPNEEPSQQEISAQFEKFKSFPAGDVTEENPYGFGYKLPARISLEYIVVKLDDIEKTIKLPTTEDAEDFYRSNIGMFTRKVELDPNDKDPNSTGFETLGFAQVADMITMRLTRQKVDARASEILMDAKSLTEEGILAAQNEVEKLTDAQYAEHAGDYRTTAESLAEKYHVQVHVGQTGILSPDDFMNDEYLSSLYLRGVGTNMQGLPSQVKLSKVVFAVDDLGVSDLGPFEMASKPRLFENIGPLKDSIGRIAAMVRVVSAEKASTAKSVNETYSIAGLRLDSSTQPDEQDTFSVSKQVAEDLRQLAAMPVAKGKADEFVSIAEKQGWDIAIDKFNEIYGAEKGPTEPNAFELRDNTKQQRLSEGILQVIETQSQGRPGADLFVNRVKREVMLYDKLYSLVPPDSNTVANLPLVMEFKPAMSYYCIRNLSIDWVNDQQYQQRKVPTFYKADYLRAQSAAAVFFNPTNIEKRLRVESKEQKKVVSDPNSLKK